MSLQPLPGRSPMAWLAWLAPWVGLANLVFVLGSSVLGQWSEFQGWAVIPDLWVRVPGTAVSGAIAGVLALLSGRLRWPSVALAGLLGLWIAAVSLGAWVLTGHTAARPLWLALTAAGLALGTAVAKPVVSGWAIFLTGCGYVYLNAFILWRNYQTLGAEFPMGAKWWGGGDWTRSLLERPEWATDPTAPQTVWKLATGGIDGFMFGGLARGSSTTASCAVFLIVFMAPFVLGRWRGVRSPHPARLALGRALLLLVSAVPGAFLLAALDAYTALAGVIFGWSVLLLPSKWLRHRRVASAAAVLVPTATLVPVLMARWGLLSANNRDCVWDSWRIAVRDSPVWGSGGTTSFPGVTCDFPLWVHSHNELLHAWLVSGILGLLVATCALGGLGWCAVRFSHLDQRTLLSTVVCATAVLSFNVLVMDRWDWIGLGMAALIAISARSVRVMSADQARQTESSGEGRPANTSAPATS